MPPLNHNNARPNRRTLLAGLALFAVAGGSTRPAEAADEPVKIHIDNFTFTPADLTVKPGTTVRWENGDDIPHSVVSLGPAIKFRSKVMDTGEGYSMQFDTPGEIAYFCGLHPHMKGRIVVAA